MCVWQYQGSPSHWDAQQHSELKVEVSQKRYSAHSVLRLMEQLETHQSEGRIILICDNARYYHARLVRDYLGTTDCRVEILFLPSYSPDLNLIERLWGFMKDHVLCYYYPTFAAFQNAITHFFVSLAHYAKELCSLMTEHFQIFQLGLLYLAIVTPLHGGLNGFETRSK